jgi:chromosome partitioning protein
VTRVVAIANQKGGVGKTTTAISLAWEVAARDCPVLLVDLDPQANATSGLGLVAGDVNMYDVLIEGRPVAETVLHVTDRLDLAPASADLAGAEVELVPAMAREYRLKRALEATRGYAFTVIDCPPSLGLLTLNALTAADEALVPVQCEYLALEGLSHLMRTLDAVRRNLNPSLELGGLLLTMYDSRTNLGQQVADEVRSHFPSTFRTVIPRNVRVSEAPSHGLPVGRYAPSSPAARAYKAFAAEFLAAHSAAVGAPAPVAEAQP